MSFEHFIKEKDTFSMCFYCGDDMGGNIWLSSFCGRMHYKSSRCSCGKITSIKVDDLVSSGHDNWNSDTWIPISLTHTLKNKKKDPKLDKILKAFG